MRPRSEMDEVRRLLEAGLTPPEVVDATNVPLSTVLRWPRGATRAFGSRPEPPPWRPPDAWSYAYLLGLYLGDGHIQTVRPGHAMLRIFLDGLYPEIVEDCRMVIGLTTFGGNTQAYPGRNSRVVLVQSGWKRWPEVFPQHGPGRKHERPIVLAGWQQEIVDAHPGALVRGLIHSDGCRTVNRFRTKLPSGRVAEYAYPRYFFSNLSADIRQLFIDACARLGVRTTRSNPRNVSVSHRDSVAVLEELVGPKA